MLTRSLTPADFGLWEFIVDIVAFASYPAGLIAFWATREIARGLKLGRTAISLSLLLSSLGLLSFLIVSFYVHSEVGSVLIHFLAASFLVPLSYLSVTSNAIVLGYKPVVSAYSLLISEIAKIVSGYFLIFFFALGLEGVIGSMALAYITQSAINTFLCKDALGNSVDLSKGKRWLLNSWIPAIASLAYMANIADTFVASIVFSGTVAVGYYQAAFSIANIVTYSSYLSTALYPMLLGGGSEELPSTAVDFTLLFGIPMAVGVAVLSKPLLFFLKPVYVESQVALVILAFSSLIFAISLVFDNILLGSERVDSYFSDGIMYLKSNLVFVPVVNLMTSIFYLFAILLLFRIFSVGPVASIIAFWSIIQAVFFSISLLLKIRRVLGSIKITITQSQLYYVAASAAMAVFSFYSSNFLNYSSRSLVFGTELFLIVLLSSFIYFGLIYAFDKKFRVLVSKLLSNFIFKRESLGKEVG